MGEQGSISERLFFVKNLSPRSLPSETRKISFDALGWDAITDTLNLSQKAESIAHTLEATSGKSGAISPKSKPKVN